METDLDFYLRTRVLPAVSDGHADAAETINTLCAALAGILAMTSPAGVSDHLNVVFAKLRSMEQRLREVKSI